MQTSNVQMPIANEDNLDVTISLSSLDDQSHPHADSVDEESTLVGDSVLSTTVPNDELPTAHDSLQDESSNRSVPRKTPDLDEEMTLVDIQSPGSSDRSSAAIEKTKSESPDTSKQAMSPGAVASIKAKII